MNAHDEKNKQDLFQNRFGFGKILVGPLLVLKQSVEQTYEFVEEIVEAISFDVVCGSPFLHCGDESVYGLEAC
jgi:hypothetical protein